MYYDKAWVVSHECRINNKVITPGTELSIKGQRGRFKFVKHVVNGNYEWIDVVGPGKESRSFGVQDVKTVHRIKKARP